MSTACARRPGGYRFLTAGAGVLPFIPSLDFWLVEFAGKRTSAHPPQQSGRSRRSISPDGKQIVFDRLRQNSDIVLIDLPK
jgi:hypothetical protein